MKKIILKEEPKDYILVESAQSLLGIIGYLNGSFYGMVVIEDKVYTLVSVRGIESVEYSSIGSLMKDNSNIDFYQLGE